MGFIVAGAPCIPRFLERVTGPKKQTTNAYSHKLHMSDYAFKRATPQSRPVDSSWVALREQEDPMAWNSSSK